MKREIQQGVCLPKGYGLAYIEYTKGTYICYPFPLNYIVRIYRDIWAKIRHTEIRKWELELMKKNEDKIKEAEDRIRLEFFDASLEGIQGLEKMIDKWKKGGFCLDKYRTKEDLTN